MLFRKTCYNHLNIWKLLFTGENNKLYFHCLFLFLLLLQTVATQASRTPQKTDGTLEKHNTKLEKYESLRKKGLGQRKSSRQWQEKRKRSGKIA
jgi:hypothetical protein